MFKKKVFLALALVSVLSFSACGGGQTIVTANGFNKDHAPALAMDGDVATGWIDTRKASENEPREVTIDFGAKKTFNKVVLDDSFKAGMTNEVPEYAKKAVTLQRRCYNATTLQEGTAVTNLVDNSVETGWASSEIPTTSAPQAVWFSLGETVTVTKMDFDNDMTGTALKNYKIYYAETNLDRDNVSNKENYTLLCEATDGMDTIIEYIPDEAMTVGSIYVEIFEQDNEGTACEASLDKVYFYEDADAETYTEDHFPVSFILMFSKDGVNYTAESADTENYKDYIKETYNVSAVYERTLTAPVTCRYVKYLVFEESNNNLPSIGELKFINE